ncbi:MAG TPA: hypothetical protein VMU35_04570 [Methylomirabilota bacterium]|nr:hypothetical protein [Methylomirabilota bacterium]
MPKETSKRKNRYGRYTKGVAVLVLVIFLSYWVYYSMKTPSRVFTVTSSELLQPNPTTPPTATSETAAGLNRKDFNLTVSKECEFLNQTTGKTSLAFYLNATNSLDMNLHFNSVNLVGYVESATNGQRLGSVPLSYSLKSGNYSDKFVLYVTLPIADLPTGQPLNILVYAGFDIQETGPILLHVTVPISQAFPSCS